MATAHLFSRVSFVAVVMLGAGTAVKADSLVIPGYGPPVGRGGAGDALLDQNNARVEPGYTQATFPPGQAVSASPQAPSHGRYGGGFIEFLVTGQAGGGVVYNQPVVRAPERPRAHALTTQHAYYDPLGTDSGAAKRQVSSIQVNPTRVNSIYERQEVDYAGTGKPGTIVIDTPHKFLFLIEPGGRALRYGIGVGRPGFEWAGLKTISRKAEWPDWTPPPEMLLRRPDLPRHMEGGPANPLGARALYLGSSMYRIHGTNEPATIGTNVSSGCIRMMNEDVIDLYGRVGVGTRVLVM
jgi:lipoprotein-anchoring transpeptidase ErfK/SrfK